MATEIAKWYSARDSGSLEDDSEKNAADVDVGTNGRVSDGGVWDKCGMKKCIANGSLQIPDPSAPPGGDSELPYVIVGDQGFGLKPYLMRPFPDFAAIPPEKRIF